MPVAKLKEFLDSNDVRYVTISHSPAFTAQQIAACAHIPGKELAKTVMIKLDGELAMVVMPAPTRADLDWLKSATGAVKVELAGESEFKDRFPGCEPGAMPPFGNLYGLRVYVVAELAEDDQIAFNAGSHTELIKMAYKDFEKLVEPQVI